jgi:TolA-binding protein
MTRRFRDSGRLAIALLIATIPLAAQQQGGQAGGAGAGTGGGQPAPGPTTGRPTNPGQQQPQTQFPEIQRPIFLSGKVMMDDGTVPPEPVNIERMCNAVRRIEAYTDSKGRFSFQLGQNQGVMQDASVGGPDSRSDPFGSGGSVLGGPTSGGLSGMGGSSGVSERELSGCEIRAVLVGYRSDVVPLAGRRSMDKPDLGTIVLHRLGNVQGTTISAVAMQAPKNAKKSFEKGKDLIRKNKLAEAQKELEKAVELYPKYSTAWYELGRDFELQKKPDDARKAYTEALNSDPKFISPYRQMTLLAFNEQKWQEVNDTANRALSLDPVSYPEIYFCHAVANYYLGQMDAAEKSAREVQKLDPGHKMPTATSLLGAILVEKHDYRAAADQFRDYLKYANPDRDQENIGRVKNQLADLEKALAASNTNQ